MRMRKSFTGFRTSAEGQGPKLVLGRRHLRAHTRQDTSALSNLTGPPTPLSEPVVPSSRSEFRTIVEVIDGLGFDMNTSRLLGEKLREWSHAPNPLEFRRSMYSALRSFAPDNFPLRSELGRRCMSFFRQTANERFSRADGREGQSLAPQRMIVQKAMPAPPAKPMVGGNSPESTHRGAQIGETRDWQGGKFRKVGPGKWEPVDGGKGPGKQQPQGKPGAPQEEEAGEGSSGFHQAEYENHIREALSAHTDVAATAPKQRYYRIQSAEDDPGALVGRHNKSKAWSGQFDKPDGSEDIRQGVSVMESTEDLASYFKERSGTLGGMVVVELEGDLSGDEDHDASSGAKLVHPTRIVSTQAIEDVPDLAKVHHEQQIVDEIQKLARKASSWGRANADDWVWVKDPKDLNAWYLAGAGAADHKLAQDVSALSSPKDLAAETEDGDEIGELYFDEEISLDEVKKLLKKSMRPGRQRLLVKSKSWDDQLDALRSQMRLRLNPQPMSLIWVAEASNDLHQDVQPTSWDAESDLIKAKYVKREGTPGAYVYTYAKPDGSTYSVRQKHDKPGSRGPYKKTRDKQGNTVYTGGDKPPGEGWASISESKQGGMRRRGARTEEHGRWEYWYPGGAKQIGMDVGTVMAPAAKPRMSDQFEELREESQKPAPQLDMFKAAGHKYIDESPPGQYDSDHVQFGSREVLEPGRAGDWQGMPGVDGHPLDSGVRKGLYPGAGISPSVRPSCGVGAVSRTGHPRRDDDTSSLRQSSMLQSSPFVSRDSGRQHGGQGSQGTCSAVQRGSESGVQVDRQSGAVYPRSRGNAAVDSGPLRYQSEAGAEYQDPEAVGSLVKGAGHRYLKRVPTGKPKPKYRYFYRLAKTKGITEGKDIQVGAKFKVEHQGQLGHFELRGHDAESGTVAVRHDESGRTINLEEKDLHRMISGHHGRRTAKTLEERKEAHREKREQKALKLRVQPTQARLPGTDKPAYQPKDIEAPAPKLPRAPLSDLGKGGFDDIAGFSLDAGELERQASLMKTPDREYAIIPQAKGFVLASKAKTKGTGPVAVGEPTEIYLRGAGRDIQSMKAEWAVVESGSLIASHDPMGFAERDDYPADVQERPYHRDKSEQMKVDAIARDLLPAMVANSNPDAINGAPIVTESGVVLGGNGRTMGMQRAYKRYPESAKKLREHLVLHGRAFGVSAAQVAGMKDPILVRRVKAEGQAEMTRLGRRMNEALTQGLDPRAAEVAVSKFVTQDVVDDLTHRMGPDQTLADFLGRPASKGFIEAIKRAGIIDERNENQFVNRETGLLNEDGRDRVARVMAARLIPDSDLLDSMNQSWRANIAQAVPSFLQAESAGWDLRPHLVAAVQSDADMQSKGFKRTPKGRKLYLAQLGLLDKGKQSPEARALLQVLHEHGEKKLGLPQGFRQIALEADRQQHDHGDQGSMFARPKVSAVESIASAFKLKSEELAASMSARAALGTFLGDDTLQKADVEPEGLSRYLMHAVLWELDNLMRGELQAIAGGAQRIDGPRMLKRLKGFLRSQVKADPSFARALGAHPLGDATLRGLCQAAAKSRQADIVKSLAQSALDDTLAKSRQIQ